VGGMVSATVLSIFFVPVFFIMVMKLFGTKPSHIGGDIPAVKGDK
jgi:multidrug efflux pump